MNCSFLQKYKKITLILKARFSVSSVERLSSGPGFEWELLAMGSGGKNYKCNQNFNVDLWIYIIEGTYAVCAPYFLNFFLFHRMIPVLLDSHVKKIIDLSPFRSRNFKNV